MRNARVVFSVAVLSLSLFARIGAEAVARAPADGDTLLITSSGARAADATAVEQRFQYGAG